jgi:hypothetical protein
VCNCLCTEQIDLVNDLISCFCDGPDRRQSPGMVCAVRHLEGLRPRPFTRVAIFCRPARSVASSLVHGDHKRWLRLVMIVAAKPAPSAVLWATTALGGIAMLGDVLKPQGLGKSLGNDARRRGSIAPTTGLLDEARSVAVFETYARERRCRDLKVSAARLELGAASRCRRARCHRANCHRANCHRANCHRDGVAMGCQLGVSVHTSLRDGTNGSSRHVVVAERCDRYFPASHVKDLRILAVRGGSCEPHVHSRQAILVIGENSSVSRQRTMSRRGHQ